MSLYNPSQDLTAVQAIMNSDNSILTLLDLSGQKLIDKANAYIAEKKKGNPAFTTTIEKAGELVIAKNIIKRSQWSDLVGSDKRLCVCFLPSRKVRNESFFEEILEIDCHVPATEDYKAWQIQEQVFKLLHKKKVNKRYLCAEPPLGELATMSGFFCCGTRFKFYRNI